MANSKLLKAKKLLPIIAILGAAGYFLNHYMSLPICMRYSKPVTMYMEWNEKQIAGGTPKRITFRIPIAYQLPMNSPARHGAGLHSSIAFEFDKDTGRPGCFLDRGERWEREANYGRQIFVSVQPAISKPQETLRTSACTRHQQIESEYDGFRAYHSSNVTTCYLPNNTPNNMAYIDCQNGDDKVRGCGASVIYKDMRVRYSFRRNKMPEWSAIQDKVFKKIDSFISDIDE